MAKIARFAGIGIVRGVLAGSRAGCGVRGALDGPTAKTKAGSGALTAPAKIGEPAEKPPHKDFLLDGLIR
jgi:hypothetical protein